jgi:hypothetical protein
VNPPSEKKINRLSPNVLKYGIPRQVMRDFHGKRFEGHLDLCDKCGGTRIRKHGFDKRVYATVIQPDGFHDVIVWLQRYRCVDCHHVMICDSELFYPHCNYGRGIVDACLYLASLNPYNRVESIMLDYGIQVDQESIKRYAIRFGKRAAEHAPLTAMGGKVNLGANLIKLIFGKDTAGDLKDEHPHEKLDAVADETHPSQKGSKEAHREENRTRKAVGEKEEKFPKSFTLASSYLHNLHCYASLICTMAPFNALLAEALVGPLRGCLYILSDGSACYNGLVDERCLWHFMKNFFDKKDPGLDRMKRHGMLPQMISEHMKDVYSIAKEEYLRHLRDKYPQLVVLRDDGSLAFLGATTTNAAEGGNWRLKYELRVPYRLAESAFARSMLIALKDSLYTFRHGRPEESFAHENGVFSYSAVMREQVTPEFKPPGMPLTVPAR